MLLSAPPNGDASLEGNVFGAIAMLLLVAYVAATRQIRRDMDVTMFMATICPIAAVAVLLAVVHGGVFHMSGTGWTYMLILTFTSGVAAQGLLVRLERRGRRDARDRRPARGAHRAERPMSGAREPGAPQSGLRARLGATRGGSSGIFG